MAAATARAVRAGVMRPALETGGYNPGLGAGGSIQGTLTGRKLTAGDNKKTRSKRASRNMFFAVATIVAAVFILVGLSAYAASLQHSNNVLTQENEYLQAEIGSLNSRIVEATKVTEVERIAIKELGMIYPSSENCILLTEDGDHITNLAAKIRHEAYS